MHTIQNNAVYFGLVFLAPKQQQKIQIKLMPNYYSNYPQKNNKKIKYNLITEIFSNGIMPRGSLSVVYSK